MAEHYTSADVDAAVVRLGRQIPELKKLRRAVLKRLYEFMRNKDHSWPTHAELADELGYSERRVQGAVMWLRQRGLVGAIRTHTGLTYLPRWEAIEVEAAIAERAAVRSKWQPDKTSGSNRTKRPVHYEIKDPEQGIPDLNHTDEHADERLEVRRQILAASREPPVETETTPLERVAEHWGWRGFRSVLACVRSQEGREEPLLTEECLRRLLAAPNIAEIANPGGYLRTMLRRELKPGLARAA